MNGFAKLGIDWMAMAIYAINFGIIAVVMARYVVRPLLHYLDERRDAIRRNLIEAEEVRASLRRDLEQKEIERQALSERMAEQMQLAHQKARDEGERIRAEATAERQQMLRDAERQIEAMKAAVEREIEAEVMERVSAILSHALRSNLPPDRVMHALSQAWKESARPVPPNA